MIIPTRTQFALAAIGSAAERLVMLSAEPRYDDMLWWAEMGGNLGLICAAAQNGFDLQLPPRSITATPTTEGM